MGFVSFFHLFVFSLFCFSWGMKGVRFCFGVLVFFTCSKPALGGIKYNVTPTQRFAFANLILGPNYFIFVFQKSLSHILKLCF